MADDPPSSPTVEFLFEGDADADVELAVDVPILADTQTTGPHVVGSDRLAQVVTMVGDTVEAIREQRREEATSAAGTATATLFPEREARVVQATQVPFTDVIALLSQGLTVASLRLDQGNPRAVDGMAKFAGRLRSAIPGVARRVDLRVYPTASANLTVLELQPRRRWMPQTRLYLRAGVPTITELTDRIEQAAAESERHPTALEPDPRPEEPPDPG